MKATGNFVYFDDEHTYPYMYTKLRTFNIVQIIHTGALKYCLHMSYVVVVQVYRLYRTDQHLQVRITTGTVTDSGYVYTGLLGAQSGYMYIQDR